MQGPALLEMKLAVSASYEQGAVHAGVHTVGSQSKNPVSRPASVECPREPFFQKVFFSKKGLKVS